MTQYLKGNNSSFWLYRNTGPTLLPLKEICQMHKDFSNNKYEIEYAKQIICLHMVCSIYVEIAYIQFLY